MHAAASFLESGLQVVVGINPEKITCPTSASSINSIRSGLTTTKDPYRIIGADDVVPD
jgi:hypothetical protein